jgi:hypothetical protein
MRWFFVHPYVVALAVAGVLLLVGGVIVSNKSAVAPADAGVRAWGGTGSNFFDPLQNSGGTAGPRPQSVYTEVLNGAPFHYNPSPAPLSTPAAASDDFDFENFLSMLSKPSESTQVAVKEDSSLSAYSFIPTGLLSLSSFEKERTPTQQKLYDYGNEVGSSIQSYEELYRNAPQILRDQFEDRKDEGKNAALRDVAGGMTNLGEILAAMEETPPEITAAHGRLAASYKEMGEKLSRIPDASNDEALVSAMLSYNASVESFTKNFVALAILFSAHDVVFTTNDPGSVFTFTNTAGF